MWINWIERNKGQINGEGGDFQVGGMRSLVSQPYETDIPAAIQFSDRPSGKSC